MASSGKITSELSPEGDMMAALARQDSAFSSLPMFLVEEDGRRRNPVLTYKAELTLNGAPGTFKWQVSADLTYGFPDPFDRKVFKVLETLILENERPIEKTVHFSLYRVLQMLGLPPFGVHFSRVRASLQRLAAVKVHAQFVSADNIRSRHQSQTFHIFDDVTFHEESFGNELGAGKHTLTLGGWYLDALNRNLVPSLDMGIFQSIQNPIASRLYELLLTKFAEVLAKKKNRWEVLYPTLCQLLPIREVSWMSSPKRQFEEAHDELSTHDIIDRAEWSKRDEGWTVTYYPGRRIYELIAAPEAPPVATVSTAPTPAPAEPTPVETTPVSTVDTPPDRPAPDNPDETPPEPMETLSVEPETDISDKREKGVSRGRKKRVVSGLATLKDEPDPGTPESTDVSLDAEAAEPVAERLVPESEPIADEPLDDTAPELEADATTGDTVTETGQIEETESPADEAVEAPDPEPVASVVEERPVENTIIQKMAETPSRAAGDETVEPALSVAVEDKRPETMLFLSSQLQYIIFSEKGAAMSGKQNGDTHCDIRYLLAWTTRSRDRVLVDDLALKARQIVREVCAIHEAKIVKGTITPDSVQLEIDCPPTVTPAALVDDLKNRTLSGLETQFPNLKQQYWGLPVWSAGFICLTMGDKVQDQLAAYLDAKAPIDDDTFQVIPAP